MPKFFSLLLALVLLTPLSALALAVTTVPQGGTASSTLSGILFGNGTSQVKTLIIGNNLTLSGSTLSAASAGAFPFTAQSYGNSTSTIIGFLSGLFSVGSTTVTGILHATGGVVGALTGNADTATKLAASKNINSVAFDGSSDITITAASSTLLSDFNTFSHTITGSVSGNAGTATALAANGTNCSAGNYPLGVDASGNSENCTAALALSSFSASYPLAYNSGTGAFSSLFSTTTTSQPASANQ